MSMTTTQDQPAPLSPVQVAIRKRQQAHRLGYSDGFHGRPSRGFIVCDGDFDLIAIYNDAKDRGFSDHRNGVTYGD